MPEKLFKIAVVAPANRLDPAVADRVNALVAQLYPNRTTIAFHPQCHLSSGHFAGDDAARTAAFLEVANDPSVDAVWFARGGYGSCRILESVLPNLRDVARGKIYLGYSDMGSLLGALYGRGFPHLVHGPMPTDITRDNGEAAIRRSLAYLIERSSEGLEPSLRANERAVAFNLKTLNELVGTPYQPDLAGCVLMIEEVAEYLYSIDRMLFHLTSNPAMKRVAGIRLGRCSAMPVNDPDFGKTEVDVIEYWCKRSGIPYLGRADIGHDADNKIVPFAKPTVA